MDSEIPNGQKFNTYPLWEVREMKDMKVPLDFKNNKMVNKSRDQKWKRIFNKRSFWNRRTLEAPTWIILISKTISLFLLSMPSSLTHYHSTPEGSHTCLCKCTDTRTKTSKERHTSAFPPLTPPQQGALSDLKSNLICFIFTNNFFF